MALTDAELDVLRGKTDNPDTIKAIAAMDRRKTWIERLSPVIEDTRVWPIVAGIVETGDATLRGESGGSPDMFGCRPFQYRDRRRQIRYDGAMSVAGVYITREGWKIARPLVQTALDHIDIPFASGHSKLVCKHGQHDMETVWIEPDGTELPQFDGGHGATGFAGSCSVEFAYRSWFDICRLPQIRRLVKVEGWRRCSDCGRPIRPAELRTLIPASEEVMQRWWRSLRW